MLTRKDLNTDKDQSVIYDIILMFNALVFSSVIGGLLLAATVNVLL